MSGPVSGDAAELRPLASAEITLKLFVREPGNVRLDELVPVFHRWIREEVLPDELPIDVASYEHVPKGPGIVLVCDKAHYSLDERHGRPGVRYRGRRERRGERGEEQIARAFRSALHAAALLEAEPALEGRYRFRTDEVELGIQDRLRAPSTPETLAEVAPALERFVKSLYGTEDVKLEMTSKEREPFLVSVRVPQSPSVEELLGRLAAPAA
ncbi:MAG TPA: hypothetical protein VFQ22_11845 [Longimicrobiales bacterium]|nr:hypothetical protein [Longimicrobiales bacterium]